MKLTGFSLLLCIAGAFISAVPSKNNNVAVDCDTETYCNECITKLPPYNFVKSYRIENEGNVGKVEYSYVFTKSTIYMINICTTGKADRDNGVLVNLYDSKRNLVAVNYTTDKVINTISYECPATGIYYIQYTFGKSATHCAGSALGFRKSS